MRAVMPAALREEGGDRLASELWAQATASDFWAPNKRLDPLSNESALSDLVISDYAA